MKLLSGYLIGTSSQALILIGTFIGRVVMWRLLGPQQYGGFGVSLNAVSVTSKLLTFGAGAGVQYMASKREIARPDALRAAIVLGLFISLGVFVIGAVVLPYLLKGYFYRQEIAGNIFPFLTTGIPAIVLTAVLASLLIPWSRIGEFAGVQLISGLGGPILFLAGLQIMPPLLAAVVGQVVAWQLALAYAIYAVRNEFEATKSLTLLVWKTFRFGLSCWPNMVLAVGTARIATLGGAYFVDQDQIGMFIIALNVTEALFTAHTPLSQLLFSRVSADEADGAKIIQLSMRLSAAFLLFVVLGFLAVGKPVMLVVLGANAAPAWSLAIFLLVSSYAHSLLRILNSYFTGAGRPARAAVSMAAEMACLLVLLPILCTRYGAVGLAVATIWSAVTGLVVAAAQGCNLMRCSMAGLFLVRWSDVTRTATQVKRLTVAMRLNNQCILEKPAGSTK